ATQRETLLALVKPLESPTTNDHPTRRSCHALLPEPLPTLRTRSPPALLPPPCAAPHTLSPAPAGCRLAPATRSDPVFHSLSAATRSAPQTPAGSCTPATAAPETHATHCS